MNNKKSSTADQVAYLKNELLKYLRFWYLFVLGVVIAFVVFQLKLRYTPKEFNTVSKIKILDKSKSLELPTAALVFNRSRINLDNEIELIKSYDVLEKVVDKTNLTFSWFQQGNLLTSELAELPFSVKRLVPNSEVKWGEYVVEVSKQGLNIYDNSDELLVNLPGFSSRGITIDLPFELHVSDPNQLLNQYEGEIFEIKTAPLTHVTSKLKNDLKVEITGRSSDVLQLSVESQNGERSEAVLDTLHKVVEEDGMQDKQVSIQNTLDFIDERFKIIEKELDSIEVYKQEFKVDNRFISPEADLQRGMASAIQSEENLFEINSQLKMLNFVKLQLQQETQELSLVPNSFNSESIDLNSLITQYNTLIFDRDRLLTSAGTNNPEIQRIDSNLAELRLNVLASIESSKEQLKLMEEQLKNRNTKINSEFAALPEKERLYRDIERQQRIKERLYNFLYEKREEALINRASTDSSIKIIEAPQSKKIISGLNNRNAILYALVLGLGIPFGVLYLVFLLDTKLQSKEDLVSANPEIPIVGEIPEIKIAKEKVFTNPNDRSVLAEAFRILSSNVDFLLPIKEAGKGQVIFCTSTIKGEGKTYASMNLSLALSSINKKVLLIGADLRNPQIHTLINKDKHNPGLSNYLHDIDFDWRDALIKGFEHHQNHDIILSGSIPPNPAHLLTNGRFTKLINEVRQEYDYVIVDTAPTILVTDTMLISKLADATLYIVRANFTDKNLLKYSKELFETGKLKNMAYVINSVGASRSYGYSYNYGYGYGYGS